MQGPLIGMPLAPSQPAARQTQAAPNTDHAEIRKVAEEFESMVLTELLAPMFSNLDTDGLGGGGVGERMFRPMLVEKYAEAMAQGGGVGLADSIVRELSRLNLTPESEDGADR